MLWNWSHSTRFALHSTAGAQRRRGRESVNVAAPLPRAQPPAQWWRPLTIDKPLRHAMRTPAAFPPLRWCCILMHHSVTVTACLGGVGMMAALRGIVTTERCASFPPSRGGDTTSNDTSPRAVPLKLAASGLTLWQRRRRQEVMGLRGQMPNSRSWAKQGRELQAGRGRLEGRQRAAEGRAAIH